MEKYYEQVKDKFVNFTGKKDLKIEVEQLLYTPYTATKEVWDGIFQDFAQKIKKMSERKL